MKRYGLTENDLNISQEKIDHQKKYLIENEFTTSNGQLLNLLDVSFSANHSERYYAQLANKINTMEQIAFNEDLVPCFLTMTLDGFYRDLIYGNYTRYNKFDIDKKAKIKKSVPNNDKLGLIKSKLDMNIKLTIKDLYNVLNHQFRQFRKGKAFKQLKKAGKNYIYIRTTEPHKKDGVPHFHMMLFIPKEFIPLFQSEFKKWFVAPRNRYVTKNGVWESFQTDIKNASGYIMKYITKSFRDVKNDKKLDYLSAWFIKHRIMRCVTSRSVLPQWIYQKIAVLDNDWYYLSDILKSSTSDYQAEWSQENDYFYIYDTWSDREYSYHCGKLEVYSSNRLVKQSGKTIYKPYKMVSYGKTPKQWSKKPPKPIPTYLDNRLIGYWHNGQNKLFKDSISPALMTDYQLYNYFHNLDIETCNLQHYQYVKNCAIERGLIQGQKISIDECLKIKEF